MRNPFLWCMTLLFLASLAWVSTARARGTSSSPPTPTQPAASAGARLTIVTQGSGAALRGAKVEWLHASGRRSTAYSDSRGIALLGERGVYALRVSAPGHTSLHGRLTVSALATVALEPTATLDVRFVDAAQNPLQGVACEVLVPGGPLAPNDPRLVRANAIAKQLRHALDPRVPDREATEYLAALPEPPEAFPLDPAQLQTRSGTDGRARFENLPARMGYRIRLPDTRAFVLDPPPDFKLGGTEAERNGTSGPFLLKPGQHLELVQRGS